MGGSDLSSRKLTHSGATVTLDALWGGPISGASMNPARSFAPALIAGQWESHWLYWIGASIGGLLYQFIRQETK